MQEIEYLEQRLNGQINWYSKKSQFNQKAYKRLRFAEILFAALIPFFAGIGDAIAYYQIIIGFLGVCIAVFAGLSALYKYHENWIEYRTTAETLKHEKFLFITKCDPYDDEAAFCKLVQRVESLISKENSQWSTKAKKREDA
jgi:hypothetical protein